jgi:pimeloyl-ACP methyl ester carboxylesterase
MSEGARTATIRGVAMRYHEHGSGMPIVILHGAGVDHREMAAALEPIFVRRPGYRRIYVDLPGMGETPAPETVSSNDDVLDLVIGMTGDVIGDDEFLVVGHSYGGYLARGVAKRCERRVAGLALLCPTAGRTGEVPEHVVLHATPGLDLGLGPEDEGVYRDYFVVQTPETMRRFQEAVVPARALIDGAALERVFGRWRLSDTPDDGPAFHRPALILTGRQDSSVGYADAWRLVDRYPRATFAVLDRAGHALLHEQRPLLGALIEEWLDRVREPRP